MTLIDITGQTFGRLMVIERAGTTGKEATWRCACICGQESVTAGTDLRGGRTQSCGCYKRTHSITHGHATGRRSTVLYRAWRNINDRCSNPKNRMWPNYGGRGIIVHPEWRTSFQSFLDYVLANLGERPSEHSFDRIDNDGNYEPGNVRWATHVEQANNRRVRYSSWTQCRNGHELTPENIESETRRACLVCRRERRARDRARKVARLVPEGGAS